MFKHMSTLIFLLKYTHTFQELHFQINHIFENFKKQKYKNKIVLFWNSKFSKKNLTTWPSTERLTPDRNVICIITRCSYSPEMKLGYMKNISHVTHFHINSFLSTRNMFKEVHVIKSCGALDEVYLRTSTTLRTFPSDWQRAVNRQPGSRSDNS